MSGTILQNDPPAAPPRTIPPDPKDSTPLDESAKATRLLFFGQVTAKILRFFTELVIARVLGPAGFGVVGASVSLTHILAEVGLVGTHRAVLRFTSVHDTEGRPRAAATVTRLGLSLALVFGISLFVAVLLARRLLTHALFGETVSVWVLPLFALAVPAIGAFTILQFRARAGRRFVDDTLVGSIARAGIPFFLTGAMFLMGWRLWGAAVGFTLGMLATLVLAFRLKKRADAEVDPRGGSRNEPAPLGEASGFRNLMNVAVPLALASASVLLINELDKVMLAVFRPEAEVGIYNAAFRISRQAVLLLPALNAAISPWVAPLLAADKRDDLNRLYRDTTRWSFAAGWSAVLLFTIFAKDFLALFGSAYVAGAHLLMLLSLGQMVNCSVGNAGVILQFSGNERKELANGLIVIVVNVALNLALIPKFGAKGAAIATLASLALVALRRLFQVRQVLGILPYDRRWLIVVAGGLLGAGVGWLLKAAVVALGGGAVFIVLAATLGMLASWTVLLMVVGITEEEASLLRVPKRWIRTSR